MVARAGIGVDNVDLGSASRRGILVVNAPDGNVITTAEHTVALLFSLARKVPAAVSSVKSGKWERNRFVGSELHAKTLGVVGLGRIGSAVAQLARGIGMNVLAYDPYISSDAAAKRGVKLVSFDEVLAQSDYITLHVPKTPETESLIGSEEIARMKKGVRIINCARGGLMDEAALAAALDAGKVAGAAMDVYSKEPPEAGHPLIGRDDVVCTPHLGASTAEAQENVAISAADQVVARAGIGVDNVDLGSASRRGILVVNAPDGNV
ncbi:MAG: phosphoglycerate dehydrogenase, partial [Candidatus Tectomicrobia bacterium]|nr:phosphoglycerate dehydrogenase [Candidatus Tectomicrobia bacterium]